MNNYQYGSFGINSMPSATQPYGYPMYTSPYMQQAQPTINTNKTYVSGIEDVKLYRLPPNSEYIFLDNEKSLLYQKKVDANGQFEVKAYEITAYNVENQTKEQQSIDLSNFVPRNEFDTLQGEIKALNERITNLTNRSIQYGAGNQQSTGANQTKSTVSI